MDISDKIGTLSLSIRDWYFADVQREETIEEKKLNALREALRTHSRVYGYDPETDPEIKAQRRLARSHYFKAARIARALLRSRKGNAALLAAGYEGDAPSEIVLSGFFAIVEEIESRRTA